jgi:hypothetical protein
MVQIEINWNPEIYLNKKIHLSPKKIHIPNLGLPSTPVMSQLLCGVAFWVTCPKHEHNFQCNLMKLPGSNDICIASKSLFLHIGCVSSAGGKYTHLACFLYLGKQHKWNTWWNLVAYLAGPTPENACLCAFHGSILEVSASNG